ncbi:MAG: rRNA maturation RNase YbeY [Pseudomonadota bacterium]
MDDDRPPSVIVTIDSPGWPAVLDDAPAACQQAVAATLARATPGLQPIRAEVSVLLGDDLAVRQLNADHRQQDKPTNVLAFPLLELEHGRPRDRLPLQAFDGPVMLGDIAVALGTVCREASDAKRPVRAHLSHLVVHGTLHLLGFDHGDDQEAEVMEDLERHILADLGIPDPYAEPADDRAGVGQCAQEAV